MENRKNVLKTKCLQWLLIIMSTSLVLLIVQKHFDWKDCIFWSACIINGVCILLIAFLYIFWDKILNWLNDRYKIKAECPYYTKEKCPYGDIEQCKYNTANCYAFNKQRKKTKKPYWLWIITLFCVGIILISAFFEGDNIEWKIINVTTLIKVLQPLCISCLAALIMAFLFDLPERMKEYQNYFISLLSSSDYLKMMNEEDLLQLRKRVTWQLHVKDVPNMPKGLISLDQEVCEMLKRPYYKEYTQIISVSKDNNTGNFRKKISIEYTAFNPYSVEEPVVMDIGFANSLKFNNDVSIEEAKKLFKLEEFSIFIDKDNNKFDLIQFISIKIAKEKETGLLYNGKILFSPRNEISNRDEPLNIYTLKKIVNSSYQPSTGDVKDKNVNYELLETESSNVGLFVKFSDKIKVKMQYIVEVPNEDVCMTKRLRYPVKYLHIDYGLLENMKDYHLKGQIIGTQMDQNNITVESYGEQKHLCLKTHNWLLPKNGAVIVICKNSDGN